MISVTCVCIWGTNTDKISKPLAREMPKLLPLLNTTARTAKQLRVYDTNAVTLGTKIKLFGGELNGTLGYAHAKRDFNDSKADVYQAMVGYKYPISKRTYAYGALGYIHGKSENTKLSKKVWKRTVERVNTRSMFMGLCH